MRFEAEFVLVQQGIYEEWPSLKGPEIRPQSGRSALPLDLLTGSCRLVREWT